MATFISFEGGEGSGKSTQAKRLADALADLGVPVFPFHEPGYTRLGVRIRELIKGKPFGGDAISPRAELMLFAAARAELVSKALAKRMGEDPLVIIADRYADSTTAYQGYGRRLPLDLVESVNALATAGVMPHKTILLDCPPERGLARVGSQQTMLFDMSAAGRMDAEGPPQAAPSDASAMGRLDAEDSRRFEEEPLAFHKRVRAGYLAMAKADPARWAVIDAEGTEDEVFARVLSAAMGMDAMRGVVERVKNRSASAPAALGLTAV